MYAYVCMYLFTDEEWHSGMHVICLYPKNHPYEINVAGSCRWFVLSKKVIQQTYGLHTMHLFFFSSVGVIQLLMDLSTAYHAWHPRVAMAILLLFQHLLFKHIYRQWQADS